MRQLRNLSQLNKFHLQARDGEIGRLKEVFFDDEHWTVRYFVVHTGNWLLGRDVLIPPSAIAGVEEDGHRLQVDLAREQIENCPDVDTSLPISRHSENDYYGYYGLQPYWLHNPLPEDIPEPRPAPPELQPREPDQPHLRSSKAVTGYHLHAQDGELGQVEDFILDDNDWTIRYLEINTHKWRPGKHVLVAPIWIHSIDWHSKEVIANLNRQAIESAPVYDRTRLIGKDYELSLYKHYGTSANAK